MNPATSLPRSGRLMAGGSNALELIWAIAALIAALAVVAISAVAWVTMTIETALAGTGWDTALLDMPGQLLDLAINPRSSAIAGAVGAWWRPTAIASALALTGLAVAARAARRWVDWRDGWRHRQRAHDRIASRVWARKRDLSPLLNPPPSRRTAVEPPAGGRLLAGSFEHFDVVVPARTSVMAIAPTRTGKTSRLVVPNLLRWDGPAVVTSVKRDVYDLTARRRAEIGPVHLFDPTGSTGMPSVRWSPLLSSTTFADATRTATWLADAASVEDKHEAAKFWETLATKLLAPMLYAAARTGRTMHHVSHWVDRAAFDDVGAILQRLGDDDAGAAWEAIRGLPAETRGSVFGTAMAIFRAFGSPRVREATSATPGDTDNTLAIGRMLHDNGTLYLVSPEYEQAELRPLFVALVQAVYRTAVELSANLLQGAPLNPPLLMMLDEAGNIAPLKNLPKIASTGAGQGITLMTIWQDRAQIRALYGENERTVIANHTTSMWLPGSQDLDTLKLLAELIGDQWVASSTISAAADGGVSISEGSERIDVAPPAFLRTLPHGNAVMLTGNLPPALITTHAYYQQRRWHHHLDPDILDQHDRIHTDSRGPTTKETWDTTGWTDELPTAITIPPPTVPQPGPGLARDPEAAGSLACDPHARELWRPASDAVPHELSLASGSWQHTELPERVANTLGLSDADLADTTARRQVLAVWLEVGPGEQLAEHITFPQLHSEWRHLELTDTLRAVWEGCYPDLGDDIRIQHPAN